MTAENVDELFGEGGGLPTPRTMLVWTLLLVGLATTFVGMACTAAPGAILVLLAWFVVEKEVDRIDSGYLPVAARVPVQRARISTLIGVIVVILLLFVQTAFVGLNVYEVLWTAILQWWVGPPLDLPPPGPVPLPIPVP